MLKQISPIFIAILLLGLVPAASAQATQPASHSRLEFKANEAFDRNDYAGALLLFRKLATELKNRPAKLGVIQDRIAICEKELAKLPPPPKIASRTPHPPPVPGQVIEISIKDLGNFDYDPDKGGNIPDDVKRLSGATIRLSGYMVPSDQIEHITQFALVPSLSACCFGQPPQIQHTIVCTLRTGQTTSYIPNLIIVEGTLTVQEQKDDGFITSIFQVQPTRITEAPTGASK